MSIVAPRCARTGAHAHLTSIGSSATRPSAFIPEQPATTAPLSLPQSFQSIGPGNGPVAFAISDPYRSKVECRGTASSTEELQRLLSTARVGGILLSFHPWEPHHYSVEHVWKEGLRGGLWGLKVQIDAVGTGGDIETEGKVLQACFFGVGKAESGSIGEGSGRAIVGRGWTPPPESAATDSEIAEWTQVLAHVWLHLRMRI